MKFGRLTVLSIDLKKREENFKNGKAIGGLYWKCECDCGNIVTVRSDSLKDGKIVSCGCYNKEILKTIVPEKNRKTNQIIELQDSILIKSSNTDDYFRIDKEDYEKVKDFCWCTSNGYAIAAIRNEKSKFARMHRIIMGCGEKENELVVDHINHDTTDNRKSNLRIVTDTQNNWNSINNHNSGVKYNPAQNKWNVYITYNLQLINLGLFDSYDEAQFIRNKAETIFYGEFKFNEENVKEKINE